MLTRLFRLLGIDLDNLDVVIVPVEQWHRVFERVRVAEARVVELEAATQRSQQVITVTRPGTYLMSAQHVIHDGKPMTRFMVEQIDEVRDDIR